MVLKGFLVAAVIFLVFSLLPYEVESQAEGPKATDKVQIQIISEIKNLKAYKLYKYVLQVFKTFLLHEGFELLILFLGLFAMTRL
jgi:hypothetical protein